MKLQKRSLKHLEIFKSVFIAFYMGGVEQTRIAAKRLKKQVYDRDCYELLSLIQTQTDEKITQCINSMVENYRKEGIL